ncbi:uncharacterized protein KY384_002197 [Bacidia gigantensis]|uniref:uncharacterized protein n=1 Tax=Bacidia gigantensis TaxID=2732470 RepID=UPI001D03B7B9|nr:uncharacterized protein KY384_002197 [Bacidia gigantensis]KAG8533414.1 hypothetical protein KY384_002197 [Bacidia gigantensis]
MEKLSARFCDARKTNVDDQWYIPRPTINKLLDRNTISQLADESNLPTPEDGGKFGVKYRPGLVDAIHAQATATLAILFHLDPIYLRYLHYIVSLIRYGNSTGSDIDHRLPLTVESLDLCELDPDHAKSFFNEQWHFIAPTIRLGIVSPVEFSREVILPLRSNETERHFDELGAFGSVTEIYVEQGHQAEPGYSGRVVRKKFHPYVKKKMFLKELHNLSILSSIRHENIVQLLSAYVQDGSFNLIFPLASHGNLEQLFRRQMPSQWSIMESDRSVLMGVSGLASALVTMHEFTSGNLRLIGCHRDLKPANVLVDGQRLLLADFGLSRIVDSQETSSSTAPNVLGDFLAPEHEGKDFIRNPIGRSSDIWAFGCIMLMLLVYYKDGPDGLEQLKSKRRREWPQYSHHCFHDYDRPNKGLIDQFTKLDLDPSAFVQGLSKIIQKLLALEKNKRPRAAAVDIHIRALIIYLLSQTVDQAFRQACESDYTHVHVERVRFQGWRLAVKITHSDFPDFLGSFVDTSYGGFASTMDHLQALQSTVASFKESHINRGRKAFLPARNRIDRLLEALDGERRASASAYMDHIMLQSKDFGWLQELHKFSQKIFDAHTERKVDIRRRILMPSRSNERIDGNLLVEFSQLDPSPGMDQISKVQVMSSTPREHTVALVEDTTFFGIDTAPEPTSPLRLQEITKLLSISAANDIYKVLRCRGYYHHPIELRSGLLYELPNGPHGQLEQYITLRQILESESMAWLLEDRFHLAHSLAAALFELHSVSWLHRNISASNIIFFYDKQGDPINPKAFYFIGFAQSRADRDLTHSDGPAAGIQEDDYYQHPKYRSQSQGFQMHHDSYALGILLLEIGIWQLYPGAVRKCNGDESTMEELVLRLGPSMGSSYRDSVLKCLDGTLETTSSLGGFDKMPMRFRTLVVEELSSSKCRA